MNKIRHLTSALPMLFAACGGDAAHVGAGDDGASEDHGGHVSGDASSGSTVAGDSAASLDLASSTEAASSSSAHSTEGEPTGDAGGQAFGAPPSPVLLVANGGTGEVTLIDPSTLEVVGSLPVMSGMHPHHIGVAPDGSKALITATSTDLSQGHASSGGHSAHGGEAARTIVYQLDVQSGELTGVLELEATAHNAAFTTDGSAIVLSMMEHGMIAGFDASSFAETFTAEGFDMPLEVTPTHTGALLVAESGAATVAVFDVETQNVVERFEVGDVPVAAWATGTGNYFVAAEEGMQLRHLAESDSMIVMDDHVIDLQGMPGQASVTPDGAELWVALEDAGKLAILDYDSHEVLEEVSAGTKPHGIVFSPDGDRAFVTDEEGGNVLVIDVAERLVVEEIPVGGKPNGIVWLEDSHAR